MDASKSIYKRKKVTNLKKMNWITLFSSWKKRNLLLLYAFLNGFVNNCVLIKERNSREISKREGEERNGLTRNERVKGGKEVLKYIY